MKHTMPKAVLGLAVALASSSLLASGLTINEQSISAMGTGFAGRSSSADDASTIYGNPAGMARLKQEQASLGTATLSAKTDISQTRSTFGGKEDGNIVPLTILLSSLLGAAAGVGLLLLRRARTSTPIPFAPYLAIAGWIALLWGGQITGFYWQVSDRKSVV